MNALTTQDDRQRSAITGEGAGLRKQTEDLTRLMLYYHVSRVQLEGGRDDFPVECRALTRTAATEARVAGFRRMRELQEAGVKIRDYEDNTLRIEGIKLAYELRRGDVWAAMERERYVVESLVSEMFGEVVFTPARPGAARDDTTMAAAA